MTFMKRIFFTALVLVAAFYSQEFNTGSIYLKVTNAGSTLFGSPNNQNLQLVRISPIISGNPGEVFDYLNDADSADTAAFSISNPEMSDFQVQSIYDNSYSFNPPAYKIIQNSYGWTDESYILSHYKVINIDSNSYQSKFGIETLPFIENYYGEEIIEYDSEKNYITIYRDTTETYVGLQFLSSPLRSMSIIEWDTAYNRSDSLLSYHLLSDSITTSYKAGALGSVLFPAIDSKFTNPDDSFDVFLSVGAALSKPALDSVMGSALDRYNNFLIATNNHEDAQLIKQITLHQNYPNPFNPSTTIEFSIPKSQSIELSIYNILGEKVETLINKELNAGNHKLKFDASLLSSGVYFYRISTANQFITKKMLLLK